MRCSLFISWFVAAGLGSTVAAQKLELTPGRALIDEAIIIQAKGLRPNERVKAIMAPMTYSAMPAS